MLKVKLLSENAKLPVRGSEAAAGYDIYSSEDTSIFNAHPTAVSTGIAVGIPEGYVGIIKPRSGLAFKYGVDTLAGVIDQDFTGEVKLLLTTHTKTEVLKVTKGERVAQMVVVPYYSGEVVQVESLEDTDRGEDGFGSTGLK